MNLNGGAVLIGGDFNFGQINCYDTILMTDDNDYLEINHNWNYITLTDMEGKWTAGLINFQGPTWEVNEASGEKSVYSSGTHSIRFYYPDGRQTILWDNPNEYINEEDGTPNTLRTFNFDYIDPTTGECLGLIFPNGYSEDLYWFRPWFEILEWIPINEWNNYPDTDGDGLPDKVEKYIDTDPQKVDTDGDGLSDYDEIFKTFTEPTLYDTDGNGTNDGQEDFDDDNLNNIEEIANETDCYDEDTDGDGLIDGDEVKIYHSDPLKYDTDSDTLSDGDDVALGFDPTLPDTDFDGTLDCDEKVRQTLTLKIDDETNPIESVSISFEGTGNINANTSITDIMGKDVLCSNVVGLIGNPYDINSASQFDEAELSFKIRRNCLGETSFDELAILWYNEDEQTFEFVDCTLDSANSVVKATLPHFSKYMIVNRTEWAAAWATSLDYSRYDSYNVVYAIDCSGSMEDLDPEPNSDGTVSKRHMAANILIGAMEEDDQAAVIGFNYTTSQLCDFTSDQSILKSSLYNLYQEGSTNFNPVLEKSISMLLSNQEITEDNVGKMIILISDGGMLDELDDPLDENLLTEAKNADIKIYTVGVGAEVNEEILHKIAETTGGEYYYTSTNEEISDLYTEIGVARAKDIDMTDFDEDGLPDIFEIVGMQLQDGTVIHTDQNDETDTFVTDPTNPDSDGDGLLDGEEIIFHYDELTGTVTFTMTSDPRLVDTDGDGLSDTCDPNPLDSCNNGEIFGALSAESLAKISEAYDKMDDLGIENNEFTSFADQSLQYTRENIMYLQKALEYLGYLDMGGAYYGRFGGATKSAVMLYQLNHRLYNEGQLDNQGIDKTTFYSILKSATDAGFEYNDMLLENSVQNYFKNNYTPVSIPMDDSEYLVVESESSNERETIYVYDFTDSLNKFLKYGANDFHTHYFLCNADVYDNDNKNLIVPLSIMKQPYRITQYYDDSSQICISFRDAIYDYTWLIDRVKNKGLYNIKLEEHWNDMCENTNTDMPFYHSTLPFVFNGEEINAEIFGNILYGYIGNAGGFSELELVGGGSLYSIIDTGKLDNSEDTAMVKKGFQMYNEVKHNYAYLHSEG
ncbi:MAG: VWA domain-containing protein, partial [Ruminococcus sp.]|nr:VWA domain-containing protein [Ruminococcus sp.]